MGDQSTSTRLRALFEFNLQAYKNKTGIALVQHPFAVQLQNCHTVESIAAIVQGQSSAFSEFKGQGRIAESVKNIISIITAVSATTLLRDIIGDLVCQKGADVHVPHL
jgi:hypothetical protein